MKRFTTARRLLTACLLWCGCAGLAQAQTAAQILNIKPKCDDVSITVPTPEEIGALKLEVFKGASGTSGYLLLDAHKRTLRKFFDSDGDGRVDTWCFFKDGAEVYRESAGQPYNFRWVGNGGMKWGVGNLVSPEKAKITAWRMISADEAAHEAFQALASGDFDRLKALFPSEQEIQALGLPAAEVQKLVAMQSGAAVKFQQVRAKLPNLPKATYSRLESAQPGAFTADMNGGSKELVKITRGLILFENAVGDKKHDWIPAPEMIQVGHIWRLTDVPSPEGPGGENDELRNLLNLLAKHDGEAPANPAAVINWTKQRVAIVQKIADLTKGEDKENWYKQIVDGLAAAVVAGDKTEAPILLGKWRQSFVTAMPGSNLAGYAVYREIWSDFQAKMKPATSSEMPKLQEHYHDALAKFVQAYSKSDDAADALIQLAMGSEFTGKEDEAKKYYKQILINFNKHFNAVKAEGAIRRLDSVGQKLEVVGPLLNNPAQQLNAASLAGKIVVVYYWATYSTQATGDFATLAKLQQTFAKDVAIITVSLDDQPKEPAAFVSRTGLQAYHLHATAKDGGGLNSPLANHYGIFGLPHLFLVGADGKVVNNKAQLGTIEEEINKLLKKS